MHTSIKNPIFRSAAALLFCGVVSLALDADAACPAWSVPSVCLSGQTQNVQQSCGAGANTTITAALAALSTNLSGGDACVVIRDTATYSEQVTVSGFTNNGFQVRVIADPSFISSAPVVNPPAGSTAAFWIANASVTIQNINVVSTNTVAYGVWASSGYITISSVNVDSGGKINSAGVWISSYNVISYSSVTVQGAHGLWATGQLNTVSYSTFSANTSTRYGLYLNSASSNTISNCVIFAALMDSGANYNTVAGSTLTSNSTNSSLLVSGNHNTVTASVITNNLGDAVNIQANSAYTTIQFSSITAYGIGPQNGRGIALLSSSSNTITGNYLQSAGKAISILNSHYNTVSQCTSLCTTVCTTDATLSLSQSHDNTVSLSIFSNPSGLGAEFVSGSASNVISQSTVTSKAGNYGVTFIGVSSNTIAGSYIQGSTAVYVSASTGTTIGGSVLVATNTTGSALWVADGSINLTVTTDTFAGGPQGVGIYLDVNNLGSISLTSNSITGGQWGVYIATMSCGGTCTGSNLTISTAMFTGGLTAGATAINFAGGTFVSTFPGCQFNDPNIAVNVNGRPLALASRITMRLDSGVKSGAGFENDPNNLVDWFANNPAPGGPAVSLTFQSSVTVTYGLVGASNYVVDASTASDFTGTILSSAANNTAATQLSPQNLTPNTTYYFRAGALWSGSTSYANTVPASTITLASVPDPLSFSGITNNQFTLSWTPNGNPPGTLYQVAISTDINFSSTAAAFTTALNNTFTSLNGNTVYFARVRALNNVGTPSNYALGAVITVVGVVTLSANRLSGLWYNNPPTIFFAQGAGLYHYRISSNPGDAATTNDPVFSGTSLLLAVPEGTQYFFILGRNSRDDTTIGTASFGPIQIDTGSPIITSLTAQNSATDPAPITNGGTTLATTPRFSWASSTLLSPIVGYSVSLSTDSAVVPGASINTTLTFIDQILSRSGLYYLKVSALNLAGSLGPPAVLSFTFTTTPGTNNLLLKNNYFNAHTGGCTQLEIDLAAGGRMKAEIYDLMGQKIISLADMDAVPGVYNYSWCGRNSNNHLVVIGAYVLHIETPQQRKDFKIFLVK